MVVLANQWLLTIQHKYEKKLSTQIFIFKLHCHDLLMFN